MTTGEREIPTGAGVPDGRQAAPELAFQVTGAAPVRFAAVPTLSFRIGVSRTGGGPVRSITLTTTVRIAAPRRRYRPAEQAMLTELFGTPDQWARTMRPLPWARATTVVAPFTDSTATEVPVVCTWDVELAVAKYFLAVRDGGVPLDFMFNGTVFFEGEDARLRTAQISWSTDTTFVLPSELWHEVVGSSSPGSAWLRLSRDTFERLYAHRSRSAAGGWDEVVNALLDDVEPEPGRQP
ncbi:hypothetical protein HUO13_23605 [Saccharopolyspora erythraea]|uniref:DUF6084 family protein n=1 Tax=Saccharopolyspora erythraea TaxID=1836 RepID=UPI001BAC066F|nr:DUF6084 family protein [Saccharopolyspora erythraea]QUH03412.1 hypothetical protein HUO13_23605 [Saccharopolyspora erythraea]